MADKKIIAIEIKVTDRNAAKVVNTTKKSVDGLATSTERLSRATNKGRAQSGLNNAILIETGRVASDAAYGMQGIANNIGRLTELFQEFGRTGKGGALGAFKELGKSLMGVGGIIVGFQLLLSFSPRIIKAFKEMAGAASILKDISESVGENAKSLVGNFQLYTKTVLDSKSTTEEIAAAMGNLNDEYPEFNANILLDKERTEEAIIAKEKYVEILEKQAVSQAAISMSQEIYGKITEIQYNKELDLAAAKLKTNEARFIGNTALMSGIKNKKADEATNLILTENSIKRINEKADAEVKKEREKLAILFKLIDITDKKKKSSKTLSDRSFKEGDLNFRKEIAKLNSDELAQYTKEQQTKITQEGFTQKELFRIRFERFKERQKLRFDDFMNSKATDSQKLLAAKRYNSSIEDAENELSDVIIAIDKRTNAKRSVLREEEAKKVLELIYKNQIAAAEAEDAMLKIPKVFADNAIKAQIAQLESQVTLQKDMVKAYLVGTDERANAEIELNNLQRDLALKSVDYQRQRFDQIQDIYNSGAATIGFISDAIKNKEIQNAGDSQEAIEAAQKKAFKIDQALKISSVIMDTYRTAWLAYGSQLIIGEPTSPVRAQIAQALALAKGAAQIVSIASTKFNSKSLGGGGGSSGRSINVEAPDFNVVGASPESQLAQTVAGSVAAPIKAFVVGKDITNQQELDRNIITTSGLGD